MVFTLIYIISVAYCLFKLSKSANNRSLDNVIGYTPGLDTLMVVVLAPFLASMDLLITFLNFIKRNT